MGCVTRGDGGLSHSASLVTAGVKDPTLQEVPRPRHAPLSSSSASAGYSSFAFILIFVILHIRIYHLVNSHFISLGSYICFISHFAFLFFLYSSHSFPPLVLSHFYFMLQPFLNFLFSDLKIFLFSS